MRAGPAAPRGGGRQGRESQPPGPAEAARPWEVACASGRKSSGRRNLGRDSHGGKLVRTQRAGGPGTLLSGLPCASLGAQPSALCPTRGRLTGFQCNPLPSSKSEGRAKQPGWRFRDEGDVDGFGFFLTGSSCLQRSLFYRCGTSLKLSDSASFPVPSTSFAVAFSSVFLFGAPHPGAHGGVRL